VTEAHTAPHDLLRRGEQGRARDLEVPVAERDEDSELGGLAHEAARMVALAQPQALGQLLGGDELRRLGRLSRGALEGQQPLAGVAQQALDAVELQPLGLQLPDQPQPLHVLRPVEPGPPADLRRGEQPARVMGAHVANRHPGLAGKLVDGQGHRHTGYRQPVLHHTT
jgi:hypothetical protein